VEGAGAPKFSLLGDYYGPVLGLDCGGPLEARMNVIRSWLRRMSLGLPSGGPWDAVGALLYKEQPT